MGKYTAHRCRLYFQCNGIATHPSIGMSKNADTFSIAYIVYHKCETMYIKDNRSTPGEIPRKKIKKIFEKVLTLRRVFDIVPIVANEC